MRVGCGFHFHQVQGLDFQDLGLGPRNSCSVPDGVGCQNYGPSLGTLDIKGGTIFRIEK